MTLLFRGDTIENGLVTRQGIDYSLDATLMPSGEWCVRPAGGCGMAGSYYGRSWTAVFVKAPNEAMAIKKANQYVWGK